MRAYRLAYDGTSYYGFQRQPDVPTVEDAIFDALRRLDVLGEDAEKPPGYAAAGRTDAGVSALAQTVAFEAPDWLTPRALNSELPADVRAWASAEVRTGTDAEVRTGTDAEVRTGTDVEVRTGTDAEVRTGTGADAPDDFHATHDAASRTYTYHLYAPDASGRLAREAGTPFEGTHDVHNLTPDDEGTVRRIDEVTVERDGEFLVVQVEAPGFCRQQVRRLVTVLKRIAVSEREPRYVNVVLGEKPLTGAEGIPPAPPHPLVLTGVEYPDLDFRRDEEAARSAREIFRERRIALLTRARVAGSIADRMR